MGRKRSKHKRRRNYSTSTDSSTSSSDGSSSNRHKNRKHKKRKHRKSSETNNKKSSRSRSRTHTSSRDRQSSNSIVITPSLDKAPVVNIRESKPSATATRSDSKEQATPVITGGRTATSTPKPSGSRDVITSGSSKTHRKSSKTRTSERFNNSPYNRTHTSTDNRQSSMNLGKTPDLNKAGPDTTHVQASRVSTIGPDTSGQLIRIISEGLTTCSTPKPSGSHDVGVEESSKRIKKSSKTHIDDKKSSRSSSRTHTATSNGQSSNSSVTPLNIDKPTVIRIQEAKSSATLPESREQVTVENIPLMSGGHAAGGTPAPDGSGDAVIAGSSGDRTGQLTSVPTTGDHSISAPIVPIPQVPEQQPVEVNKVAMESPGVSGASQPASKESSAARDEVWKSELQCSICSELFIKATMLNCSHTFCEYCIRMWQRNKLQCPLCRTSITSESRVKILDSLVERISQTSEEKKLAREEVLRERHELETNHNTLHPPRAETARTVAGAPNSDITGGSLSPDLQLDYYDFYETDNGYADSNNDDGDDDIEADEDYAFYDGSGDQNENDSDHYYTEIDNDENDEIVSFGDNDNNEDQSDDPNEEAFVHDSDYANDESEINDASGDNDGNSNDDNDEVSVDGHEESVDGHEESVDDHEESVDGHEESVDDHEESVDGQEESVDGQEESVDGHEVSYNSQEVSDNSNEVSDNSNVVSDGEVENEDYDDGNDDGSVDDGNDGGSVTDNNDDDEGEVAYENSDDNLNDYNSNNESNHDYDHNDENECDYSHGGSGDNESHYDNVNDDYDDDNDNGYDENNCDSGESYNSDSS